MNTTISKTILLLATSLLWPAAGIAATAQEEIDIEYRRGAVQRPAAVQPSAGQLPGALRVEEAPDGGPVVGKKSHTPRTPRHTGEARSYADLETRARLAASWSARHRFETEGRRQYLRAGFYDGLHAALDDPALGRWDYYDGLRRGERDPWARRQGAEIGRDAAEQAGAEASAEQVSAQFHDLAREPRYQPRPADVRFTAGLPRVREPRLRRVFREHFSGSRGAGLEGIDPWEIYRRDSYGDVYDARWSTPDAAFAQWLHIHREQAFWRQLEDEEKNYFRTVFERELSRQLAPYATGAGTRAYRRGFDEGWQAGAAVNYEWSYRRGFHEGTTVALRDAAEETFFAHYPGAYDRRYGELFEEWSTTIQPEIRAVFLADESDDGVFEPGEGLSVGYELVNYGGRGGELTVHLGGYALSRDVSRQIRLPRRRALRRASDLPARVDPAVRPRTDSELELTVAGLTHRTPLRVSYPLELEYRARLRDRDTLAGWARVEVAVANTSTRPVTGTVELFTGAGERPAAREKLAALPPGAARAVAFEIAGLHPLDLLAGEVDVRFVASSAGKVHDRFADRLPRLAADLTSRDLVEYMLALGRSGGSASEVARAQELMLRRLEVDWQAAVATRGNPYKQDFKKGSRRTALGDLVESYRGGRPALARHEVFTELAPRIEQLAESLPGAHPFLRRYVKKLGRELRS